MKSLGVNIDHVATLRQARKTIYPDPAEAARLAVKGGADQITVHLREDRRHIQDGDLGRLTESIRVPLNLEMAAIDEMAEIACSLKPATATLVPERREELTTEGGLEVIGNRSLPPIIERLRGAGIKVSLFIDPDVGEVKASRDVGADAVELHTGTYCDSISDMDIAQELARLAEAANAAHRLDMKVAAGHGLQYENIKAVLREIPAIVEYNIGHSIVSRAIFVGMESAVREMKKILEET